MKDSFSDLLLLGRGGLGRDVGLKVLRVSETVAIRIGSGRIGRKPLLDQIRKPVSVPVARDFRQVHHGRRRGLVCALYVENVLMQTHGQAAVVASAAGEDRPEENSGTRQCASAVPLDGPQVARTAQSAVGKNEEARASWKRRLSAFCAASEASPLLQIPLPVDRSVPRLLVYGAPTRARKASGDGGVHRR